jgi:hypothetical protein
MFSYNKDWGLQYEVVHRTFGNLTISSCGKEFVDLTGEEFVFI